MSCPACPYSDSRHTPSPGVWRAELAAHMGDGMPATASALHPGSPSGAGDGSTSAGGDRGANTTGDGGPPAERAAKASAGRAAAAAGSGCSDSDETHDSMPELVPVSPKHSASQKHCPSPAPAASARSLTVRALAARMLARQKRGGPRGRAAPEPWQMLAAEASPASPAAVAAGWPEPFASGNAAWEGSGVGASPGPTATSYGERAKRLAAALDGLSTRLGGAGPAAGGGPPAELPSASGLPLGSALSAAPAAEEAEEACNSELAYDVEVSEAAAHRAEHVAGALLEDGFLDESDSEDEEFDDEEDGDRPRGVESHCDSAAAGGGLPGLPAGHLAKRRRREDPKRWQPQRPPGAPAAAPASARVVAAAAAAAGGPGGAVHVRAAGSQAMGGASYGPRFQGLSTEELGQAQARWALHSLAEVPRTSSQENLRAAAALFEELRRRREAAAPAEAAVPPGAGAPEEPTLEATGAPSRPTFRRRPGGKQPGPLGAGPEEEPASGRRTATSAPGTFIAEECMVGVARRRRPLAATAPLPTEAAAAPESAVASADGGKGSPPEPWKRRRQLVGAVCAALDDEGGAGADE